MIKALSIAQRFIVVRLLLPVQGITAPYEQKFTSFKLVREPVSGAARASTGYCEFDVQGLHTSLQGLPRSDEEIYCVYRK